MTRKLFARNLLSFREAELSIEPGLSVLVGPNASGKTTLLKLGAAVAVATGPSGTTASIEQWFSVRDFRFLFAGKDEPVLLGIEEDTFHWQVAVSPAGGGIALFPAERLQLNGSTVYDVANGVASYLWEGEKVERDTRSVLRQLHDRGASSRDKVAGAIASAKSYRVHLDYVVSQIRERGSPVSGHRALHPNGFNAFSVLRNWRDKSADRPRWELVRLGLRECFDWFGELDFESTAQSVSGQIVFRHPASPTVSVASAANGWFIVLLHLCALASAEEGDTVAIDEFEMALHPRAINSLLDIFDDYLRGRSISVILASHSPTVLDWFDNRPERIWVLQGNGTSPRRLTENRDREWLTHFRLGQLFQSPEGFSRV